jgi:hypothetical protein
VSAHIVLPARRSHVPGEYVRECTNPTCSWTAHGRDPIALAELARAHSVDPDADAAPAGGAA